MMKNKQRQVKKMKLTVIQPKYYAGDKPDEQIAAFLLTEAEKAEAGSLVVLPVLPSLASFKASRTEPYIGTEIR